jgi:formate hydrogenlyase transcriptional activator
MALEAGSLSATAMNTGLQSPPQKTATERYEALFRLSQAVNSNCCSEELLKNLVRELRDVVEFYYLGIGIYDEKTHELEIKCFDHEGAPIEVPKFAPEETLTWWVYQHQQPLVVPDIDEETRFPRAVETLKKHGIRSVCSLPLTTTHRRVGGLAVGSQEADMYNGEEISFLWLVANQMALAVDAALSFEASEQAQRELQQKHAELQAERDRLELLLDLTNQVVSNLELPDLLRATAATVRRVMHCDGAGVALLDPTNKQLLVYAKDLQEGNSLVREEHFIPVDEDSPSQESRWSAFVLRTGEPLNLQRRDLEGLDPATSIAAAEGFQCVCLLPLISRDRRLGTLALGRREDKAFSQDDVDFLSQVAKQIAIAVENAEAYRKIADLKDKLAQEKLYLEDEIRNELNFAEIVGQGAALRRALGQVETVAPTVSTVLIHGETGTGKELIARAIHDRSPRSGGAFVKLNCAAIPTGLLESELFGHEKGAFTGAVTQRIGRFELANGGTIFLDEVGEIPLELQPKLLRVLQEREFERLGSGRTLRTDARLIAATNRDLSAMVEEGKFRSDLFYRLNVFPVHVPPLRERSEDIPLLIRHFAEEFSRRMNKRIETIPSETLRALARYHWPGNIRELQNVIERAVILSPGPVLRVPVSVLNQSRANGTASPGGQDTLEEAERKHILKVLDETSWVLAGPQGAANRLGMKRSTLQYRMTKLGIVRSPQSGARALAAT